MGKYARNPSQGFQKKDPLNFDDYMICAQRSFYRTQVSQGPNLPFFGKLGPGKLGPSNRAPADWAPANRAPTNWAPENILVECELECLGNIPMLRYIMALEYPMDIYCQQFGEYISVENIFWY